jgi:hypothetical protein
MDGEGRVVPTVEPTPGRQLVPGGRLFALAALATAAIGTVFAAGLGPHATPAAAAASQTPAQLLQAALRDATGRGSVHETESASMAKLAITFSDDVSASEGTQDIHIAGAGETQTIVVNGTAYFVGQSQAVLQDYFGFSAALSTELRGRWVSVPRSSSAYASVAADATLSSALSELSPPAGVHLAEIGSSRLDGAAVIGIRGLIPGSGQTPGGTATYYVTDSRTPLPVQVDLASSKGRATIDLTRWGELVSIKAPSGAIPIANLEPSSFDAAAEELVHTAQVTAETYATDHSGSYAGITPAALHSYEDTIQTSPGRGDAYVSSASGNPTGYTITVTAARGGDTFSITRTSSGAIHATCTPASGIHGACVNGTW